MKFSEEKFFLHAQDHPNERHLLIPPYKHWACRQPTLLAESLWPDHLFTVQGFFAGFFSVQRFSASQCLKFCLTVSHGLSMF